MWTYKEGVWVYWSGTLQADRFIGDGSQLTGLPASSESDPVFIAASSAFIRTETDPIFNAASAAMNTQISSSSNAIIASGTSWTGAVANALQGVAASNAIIASKAQWMTYPSNSAGIAASNAVTASAAVWQAAVTNYPAGVAASNAIIASKAQWMTFPSNAAGIAASNAILNYTTIDNDATSAALLRNIVLSTASAGMTVTSFTQGTVLFVYS